MQEDAIVIEDDNMIETTINNALVKRNITDQVIAELKNKFGHLRLKAIDDKESYLEIKQAHSEVRKVRTLAEKICKAGRADAIKIQRMWIDKQKEVLGRIAEVEDPLMLEEERFENEIARKEREEAEKREKAFADRQRQLLKFGAQYDHGCYILNHIEYDSQTIKDADDEIWMEIIYPKYAAEYNVNEQARALEEKKRQQEIEELKKKNEEFDRQQAEFRKAQEDLRQQQEAVRKQQEVIDRANRLAEQKLKDDRAAAEAEQIRQQKEAEWQAGAAEREEQMRKDAREKAEQERQQEIARQQQEMAAADDKTKWVSLVDDLKLAVAGYQMKSPTYRRKLAIAREKIEEISEL